MEIASPHNTKAKQIAEHFIRVRKRTERICAPLNEADYTVQIAEFASPMKWHLAHTTWFFETFVLQEYKGDYSVFDTSFNYLFNSYYNHVGSRIVRNTRGNITRPVVEDIYRYRTYVDEQIVSFLNQVEDQTILDTIELGLNHEEQHQELMFTDLKFNFGNNPVLPVYDDVFNLVSDRNEETGVLSMNEGMYSIGFEGNTFHYDNEEGKHQVYLPAFNIDRGLVTNGEFIEFIQDSGYERHELWLDEGWSWRTKTQINTPMYWLREAGEWKHYTLSGLKTIDPDAILTHISFYEAFAFSQWKGRRLPTEFEWEAASDQLKWGARWEWSYSAYHPYPGFKKPDGAIGEYNGKFMINQMVLRGASTATSPGHSRKTYRNFFHPDARWQVSGIRLAD